MIRLHGCPWGPFPLCVAPDPEASPTLRWLRERGIALGVVTDGTPETQRAKITALGLDGFFAVTYLSSEVGLEKFDAHFYQQAAEALEAPPSEIWIVSALPQDCLSARDAGLGAILLRRVYYWPCEAEPPTHEIASLGELNSLLVDNAQAEAR